MDSVSKTLKYILIAGVLATPFLALVVSNSMFFPFITGKNFTFRILVELLGFVWLILMIRDPQFRPRFSWILVAFTAFLVVIGVTGLFGMDFSKSFWSNFERMEGYITLLHLFVYFLILGTVFTTHRLWTYLFHTWIGVGGFLALYGLMQLTGGLETHQGSRLDATLGNATYLAATMLFVSFFVIYFMIRWRTNLRPILTSVLVATAPFVLHAFMNYGTRVQRAQASGSGTPEFFLGGLHAPLFTLSLLAIAGSIVLFVMHERLTQRTRIIIHTSLYSLFLLAFLFTLLHTETRGAILGVMGGFGVTALLIAVFYRGWPLLQRSAITVTILGVVVAGLLGALVYANSTGHPTEVPVVRTVYTQMEGLPGLERVANISLDQKTVRSRFMVWGMASQGFLERPVLGWGQGNFNYVFSKYYDPGMYDQEPWFDRAHNVIFDWLIAGGVFGLLTYLAIVGTAFYHIWRDPKESFSVARIVRSIVRPGDVRHEHFSLTDKSILTGLFAAYLFHNLFVFDQLISYLLFMAVLGYIHVRSQPDDARSVIGEWRLSPQVRNAAVVPVLGIVLVVVIYAANVRPMQANTTLIDAMRYSQIGRYEQSLQRYDAALAMDTFGNAETRERLSATARRVAQKQNVSDDVRQAYFNRTKTAYENQLAETPKHARYLIGYGTFLRSYGLQDQALAKFEEALELTPKKQVVRFMIGDIYLQKEQYDKALSLFKDTFMLEPSYHQARALYAISAIYAGDDAALEHARTHAGELTRDEMAMNDQILRAYRETKRYEEAAKLHQRKVDLLRERASGEDGSASRRDVVKAYVELASTQLQRGQRQAALDVMQKAISYAPQYKEQLQEMVTQIENGKALQ